MPEMIQRGQLASTSPPTSPSDPQSRYPSPQESGDPHVPDSIPPWVHLAAGDTTTAPQPTRPNTRHWKPPPPQHYRPGRKWDHLRNSEPAMISIPIAVDQESWKPFMLSGPNPEYERDTEAARLMNAEWIDENMPIARQKWKESDEQAVEKDDDAAGFWLLWFLSPQRRERTTRVFWRLLLKNPFVPLVSRLTVLAFAAASLGIAATIYSNVQAVNTDADPNNQCAPRASTYMTLVVASVAVPYIGYMMWDEYTSKPLGLRSAVAKTSLLLTDLYFLVFFASNLSLAFEALLDHGWACYNEQYEIVGQPDTSVSSTCANNPNICYKQKTLSAVLFLSLVAWLMTFSISVMRVVEKLRTE